MNILEAAKTIFRKQGSREVRNLTTPWTDSVKAEHVLNEYPRPQMVRNNYQIHNGIWEYMITDAHCDYDCVTASDCPETFDGQILVPFSPEAPLSGVNRILLPGQALWYRYNFQIKKIPSGHRLLLHFGAVDERCAVFVNREPAGRHRGGYLPFTFDITDSVHAGDNQLFVYCLDDSDTESEARGKQKLKRGGMFYTPQSGIWQTVWSEWVPDLHIESFRITPSSDNRNVHIKATICAAGSCHVLDQLRLSVEVARADRYELVKTPETIPFPEKNDRIIIKDIFDGPNFDSFQDSLKKNTGRAVRFTMEKTLTMDEKYLKKWSPESPWLYPLCLNLQCEDESVLTDSVTGYLSMRSFSLGPDSDGKVRLRLNQEPYFQNGLLDQGYWPDGLYTAPCDDALVYDIVTMKKAGFNMLRKHCKLEPLRWYYHCDRLGMIVWQDMVNGGSDYNMTWLCYLPTLFPFMADRSSDIRHFTGRKDEAANTRWRDDMEKTISHLYNCPSIGSWVLFNEGWGQFDTDALTDLFRELDPTRTIDQASGWFDHRGGDMRSVHNYFRKLTCPVDKTGGRALVISEYGGLAYPVKDHTRNNDVYGYRILKSQDKFCESFHKQQRRIKELVKDGLSAAVYTQVSDIEDEVNGILTYDRRVNKLNP